MKQAGFTLIELIMVIVILGILAATALPRFVDLSGEAAEAARDGVLGAARSAAAINFAAVRVGASGAAAITNTGQLAAQMDLTGDWSASGTTAIAATLSGTQYCVSVTTAETATSPAVIGTSCSGL